MYYIGIDLGTSAVKLLLMEESGKSVTSYPEKYSIYSSHIRAGLSRNRRTGSYRAWKA